MNNPQGTANGKLGAAIACSSSISASATRRPRISTVLRDVRTVGTDEDPEEAAATGMVNFWFWGRFYFLAIKGFQYPSVATVIFHYSKSDN